MMCFILSYVFDVWFAVLSTFDVACCHMIYVRRTFLLCFFCLKVLRLYENFCMNEWSILELIATGWNYIRRTIYTRSQGITPHMHLCNSAHSTGAYIQDGSAFVENHYFIGKMWAQIICKLDIYKSFYFILQTISTRSERLLSYASKHDVPLCVQFVLPFF